MYSRHRYFLLPVLLGDLTLQVNEDRLDVLHKARVYFVDYLQRCKSYSITTDVSPREKEAYYCVYSFVVGPPRF